MHRETPVRTSTFACSIQDAHHGGPVRSPASFAQHQLDLIDIALYDIAMREGALLLKVLQNISRALIELCHFELAFVYALAAVQLCARAPPKKAAHCAMAAAHKMRFTNCAIGIARQVPR